MITKYLLIFVTGYLLGNFYFYNENTVKYMIKMKNTKMYYYTL